jgi:selenide,water dikinase
LVSKGQVTGGAAKNGAFLGELLSFSDGVLDWLRAVVLDPQTSGGLALFSRSEMESFALIGKVVDGPPGIHIAL